MKKTIALLLIVVMLLSLVACGNSNPDSDKNTVAPSYDSGTLEGILESISADFAATAELLETEWTTTQETIGDTYEGYTENQQALLDWYDLVDSETTALYKRTNEKVIDYYKLVAQTVDHEDDDALEDATDEIYDVVYEDCFDELYDIVYDDLYDDIYDEYYDGIIDDAEDTMDFGDWLDVRSDFYGTWLDVRSDFYGDWLDARSNFYGMWLDMRSAFRYGNFDIDAIIAENTTTEDESNKPDDETTEPTVAEGGPSLDATPVDGVEHQSGDFKYIILTDGTIEITKYIGNEDDVTISSSYDGYEVSRIGNSAFEGCTTVEDIIMWPDVIVIGDAAFKGCTELEEFSIPSSVTVINESVFEDCTSLESIIIWGDITSIGNYAFRNCTSLEDVSIPSSCVMIGESAFEGCADMEDVIFWGGETIGDRAFKDCVSLTDISIPSEVTAIGVSAFEGCLSLESVIIWGDDVSFGVNAFANCPKLDKLPDGAYNDGTVSANGENTTDEEDAPDGIRPEFKEAMDAYEAFYDEYCDLLAKYYANPTDMSLLTQYTELMGKAVDMDEAFAKWESEDLNNEELKYYLEVNNRVMQKLLDVMG